MQTQVNQMLQYTMNKSMVEYGNGNVNLQNGVDFMQSTLKCCGVLAKEDWYPLISTNDTIVGPQLDSQLPRSCCHKHATNLIECEKYYENGCLHQLHYIISQSTMLISTGATTVAFVQVRKENTTIKWLWIGMMANN